MIVNHAKWVQKPEPTQSSQQRRSGSDSRRSMGPTLTGGNIDGRIEMARAHFDLNDQQIIEALAEQLSTLYYFAIMDGETNYLKAV